MVKKLLLAVSLASALGVFSAAKQAIDASLTESDETFAVSTPNPSAPVARASR